MLNAFLCGLHRMHSGSRFCSPTYNVQADIADTCSFPFIDAAAVLRKDVGQFERNVDGSLRGRSVAGVSFPKNSTYSV